MSKNRTVKLGLESFERRDLPAALPVLLVIADQQDFYFQEYNDTRNALLSKGVPVVVAATTTNPSKAHAGTGQGTGTGIVTPNIALADVDSSDYSAIAFVGGWGASMYQYAYNDPYLNGINDNYYFNAFYNGDTNLNDGVIAPQKVVVNTLINEFLAEDKPVAGVCHGVTVLAWARVNGVSPLNGKSVVVPHTDGTPGMFYAGTSYAAGFAQGQYIQTLANGAKVSAVGGQVGNPTTSADDVIVDGRIITAENQHSAWQFGLAIAKEVNLAPTITGPASSSINEGTTGVLAQFTAIDPEGGPVSLSLSGANANLFSISSTGTLSTTQPLDGPATFDLTVRAKDQHDKEQQFEFDLVVANMVPTATGLDGPDMLIAGQEGTFTLHGVVDVAADLATMKYSIQAGTLAADYNQASSGHYTQQVWSTVGTHTVNGRAYDKDGGISTTVSRTVQVVAPPTTVVSVQVNDGAAQRSRVTSLSVTFNQAVTVADLAQPGAIRIVRDDGLVLQRRANGQNDFTVAPLGGGSGASSLGIEVHCVRHEMVNDALYTPPGMDNGSLSDGRWRIEIPSMNYQSAQFFRLYGDSNGDANVDAVDFAFFGNFFGGSNPIIDADANGAIDATDFAVWGNNFGRTL